MHSMVDNLQPIDQVGRTIAKWNRNIKKIYLFLPIKHVVTTLEFRN